MLRLSSWLRLSTVTIRLDLNVWTRLLLDYFNGLLLGFNGKLVRSNNLGYSYLAHFDHQWILF